MVDGSTLNPSRPIPNVSESLVDPARQRKTASPPVTSTDGPSEPVPRPQAVNLSRAQILHATAICLAEAGYDGTTIRRIARELGCAVGSIYRYFDDKRSLLDAVTQARFEPVAQVAEVSAERSAALYAHAAADEPQQYRLMFWLASAGDHQEAPGVPDVIQRIITAWETQMGDRRKAERFWSQLHGRIMLGEVGPSAT